MRLSSCLSLNLVKINDNYRVNNISNYILVIIVILFSLNNFSFAGSNIQQGDILAFDPTRACDVLAVKLEKMDEEIGQKQKTINELHKILMSAAKRPPNYGNIRSEYIRTFDQLKSMKQEYGRLVLAQEKHCMSDQDTQSVNEI